jgi:hypothetical protein
VDREASKGYKKIRMIFKTPIPGQTLLSSRSGLLGGRVEDAEYNAVKMGGRLAASALELPIGCGRTMQILMVQAARKGK